MGTSNNSILKNWCLLISIGCIHKSHDKSNYQRFPNDNGGDIPQTYGVPVDEIVEGIKYGVRKVNIDTDLRMASTGAMRRYLAQSENTAELDARKVYKAARDAMQVLCQARYELFGAAGHASKIKAIPLSEMAKRYQSDKSVQTIGK